MGWSRCLCFLLCHHWGNRKKRGREFRPTSGGGIRFVRSPHHSEGTKRRLLPLSPAEDDSIRVAPAPLLDFCSAVERHETDLSPWSPHHGRAPSARFSVFLVAVLTEILGRVR